MAKPEYGKTPASLLDENGKFVDKFDQGAKLEAARAAKLAESGIVYDKSEAEFRGAEANRAKFAFVCPECKQHFSIKLALDHHMATHKETTPTKKFCPNCGTECAFKAKFCPGCGKTIPEQTKAVPRGMEEPAQKAPVAAWMAADKGVKAFDYSYREKQKNPDLKPGEREVWVDADETNDPKPAAPTSIQSDKPAIAISADGRYKTTKIVGRDAPNPNRPGAGGAVAVADPSAAAGSGGVDGPKSRKGWLRKAAAAKGGKDQVRGNWKDRWFVLAPAGALLSYFETQASVKPKGVIPLRGAQCDFRSDVVGAPFVVWIATADGKFFYLEARSLEEANAWIGDIQAVIAAKK
jgi:hypothetical protein